MRYLNPILILLPRFSFCSSDFAGSSNRGCSTGVRIRSGARSGPLFPSSGHCQFFLTGSLCGIAALITQNRTWLVPTMMLCMFAASAEHSLGWCMTQALQHPKSPLN